MENFEEMLKELEKANEGKNNNNQSSSVNMNALFKAAEQNMFSVRENTKKH